jgi:hypothetical protein
MVLLFICAYNAWVISPPLPPPPPLPTTFNHLQSISLSPSFDSKPMQVIKYL